MTETVTAFLTTRNSFYISFLVLMIFMAPFVNVLYYGSSKEGIFGFAWMSSFLFAIITPISYLCFGLLLRIFLVGIDIKFKKIMNLVSFGCILIGCFYVLYTLIPMQKDLPRSWYYFILVVTSMIYHRFTLRLNDIIINYEVIFKESSLYKSIIRRLFDFIIIETPSHIKNSDKSLYKNKSHKLLNDISEHI